MHADFSTAAKAARAQLSVPAVDLREIQERARSRGLKERFRAIAVSAAFALGALGTAAALAANAGGMRVWLFGDKAAIAIDSFADTYGPTMNDLRAVTASATFPVVLPVGVPRTSRMMLITYSPADHPNVIWISYIDPATHRNTGVLIVDSRSIATSEASLPANMGRITSDASKWTAGKETVIVGKRYMSAGAVQRLKDAMISSDPASSLAANAPSLARIPVLPRGLGFEYEQLGDRYAPANGRSVMLLAPVLRQIPELARDGKPLPDLRTVYVTHVPAAHGEPNYSKATVRFPKAVALAPAGVRAVDAVVRSSRITPACKCAILLNERPGSAYRVWVIDLARPERAKQYSVDPATLKVSAGS